VYEPARLRASRRDQPARVELTLGDNIDSPGCTLMHDRCYQILERAGSEEDN
jgi:hypothetical protein